MPDSFEITTVPNTISIDQKRSAEVSFTVSNLTTRALRGRAQLVAQQAETADWLSLAGEIERDFAGAATEEYTVQVVVPPTADAGSYPFRLDMLKVDGAEQSATEGPNVTLTVGEPLVIAPKKPFPWWIVAAGVALFVLVMGAFYLVTTQQTSQAARVAERTATAFAIEIATSIASTKQTTVAEANQTSTVAALANQTSVANQVGTGIAEAIANQTATGAANQTATGEASRNATAAAAPNQTTAAQAIASQTAAAIVAQTRIAESQKTSLELTLSPTGAAARGQPVTIAAQVNTVDGKTAEGSVAFAQNAVAIPECAAATSLGGGRATCVITQLSVGEHNITAVYNGDTNHKSSEAAVQKITINPAQTSVSLSSRSEWTGGIPVWRYIVSATVNNTSSGAALVPTGKVIFTFTGAAAPTTSIECTLGQGGCSPDNNTTSWVWTGVTAQYLPDTADFVTSSASAATGR